MMRNPFTTKVRRAIERASYWELEMLRFSGELMEAAGMSAGEVDAAERHRLQWELTSCYVRGRRCLLSESGHGWCSLLVAAPISAGTADVGWRNREYGEIDSAAWFYAPSRTETVICPRGAMWEQVLYEVRKYVAGGGGA